MLKRELLKKAGAVLLLLLVMAFAVSAFAEVYRYCTEDKVKVYETRDSSSKVIRKLSKKEKVILEVDQAETGDWCGILCTAKDGSHMIGWVQRKYLTDHLHSWGDWKVTKKPSCTKEGQKERTCKICGRTQSKSVEKNAHDYGKWSVTREPTCTEEGLKQRKCKVCGEKQKKAIEKAPHNYGKWTVLREATCSSKGERKHVCRDCGHEEKSAIRMLPHSFGEWNVIVAATDHSSGVREHVCQNCGYGERVDFDPDGTLRRKDRGDDVRALQQLLVDQGYLKAGGVDGVYGGGTEKALIQFQKDQGLNPDGIAWPQTLQRLRHDYGEWTVTVALTRASDGERVRVCKDCGHEERQVVKAEPSIARKQKGGDVKSVQTMLNEMGFSAGKADGAYGPKLDAAFGTFAEANGLSFAGGRLLPADADALVNAWIASRPQGTWMGEGGKDSPVNLILRVTPSRKAGEDAADGMRTFDWSVINLGSQACTFRALLMGGGAEHDFMKDDMVAALDWVELKPDGANSAEGSITLPADWAGEDGIMRFSAVAAQEKSDGTGMSNAVACDMG